MPHLNGPLGMYWYKKFPLNSNYDFVYYDKLANIGSKYMYTYVTKFSIIQLPIVILF
jgi:hypothetical protein